MDHIRRPEQAQEVVALLRAAYDRAMKHPVRDRAAENK